MFGLQGLKRGKRLSIINLFYIIINIHEYSNKLTDKGYPEMKTVSCSF